MAHTALARQYRPRTFAEVSGQSHVSETLRRAIATDRIGHAYLFCGPRGVGKTTLARVLAMALNCPDRTSEGEPCGICDSCERIWNGRTVLDVVEIDAASNRGVDDARDLRTRAMYSPSEDGRYKVYIVDEAHMLTREAWNALLKILEEPPPRVIFVFATTEPGKIERVASPILSRCQRFDFRRFGTDDIVRRLAEVLEREGEPSAPEDALRAIARRAEGGMRDALSLLDQVLALTDGAVETAAVRRVLGLVEDERYAELMELVAQRKHASLFDFVEALESEGYDLVEFHHGFVDALRGLLKSRLCAAEDPSVEGAVQELSDRAASLSSGDLLRMLRMASELDASGQLKRTGHPRLLLELLFLQLSHLDRTVELTDVLQALRAEGVTAPQTDVSPASTRSADSPVTKAVDTAPAAGAAPPARVPVSPEPTAAAAPPAVPVPDVESSVSSGSPIEVWAKLLDDRRGIPPGLSPLLRGVDVRERDGCILSLSVPAGPIRDRLGEPGVRASLQRGLTELAGRPLTLEIDGDTPVAEPARITLETVREGRFQEEVKREPLLARAVEELDLEPID